MISYDIIYYFKYSITFSTNFSFGGTKVPSVTFRKNRTFVSRSKGHFDCSRAICSQGMWQTVRVVSFSIRTSLVASAI